MLDPFDISIAIALVALVAILVTFAIVVAAVVVRFRGRRPGRRWGVAVALGFGVQAGCMLLLTENDPLMRIITLAFVGFASISFLWRRMRVQAGALIAGTAAPWTILWGYYLVLLLGGTAFEATVTWMLFLAGLIPLLIGLGLMLAGQPLAPEPDPAAPAGEPGSRRIGIVAQTVLAPESIGPMPISELAAFVAEIVIVIGVALVGLPFPLEPIAQVGLATLAGNATRIVARPARARRAYEAFSWLAEWEVARVRQLTGMGPPLTKRGAATWYEKVPRRPDTAWIRVEILALLERLDEARAVVDEMPTGTPYERFERAHAIEFLDWMAGRTDGDPASLEAAAAEIDPSDEGHLRARVAIAIREAARIAADRGPELALEPLLRIRDTLGSRADNQLVRALWGRYLPLSFVTALVVTAFAFNPS